MRTRGIPSLPRQASNPGPPGTNIDPSLQPRPGQKPLRQKPVLEGRPDSLHSGDPGGAAQGAASGPPARRRNALRWLSPAGRGQTGTGTDAVDQQPERNGNPISGPCIAADLVTNDLVTNDLVTNDRVTNDRVTNDPLPLPKMRFGLALPKFGPDTPVGISLFTPVGSVRDPGPWQFAQELLDLGVLRESDWTGDLEASIQQGLNRWVNKDLGASSLRILSPLKLYAANDARRYFLTLIDDHWRSEMKALPHWPIGFFALSWDSDQYQPIFVAKKVQELESLLPGLGYGLLELVQYAFEWTINGKGFRWGHEMAVESEERLCDTFMQMELDEMEEEDYLDEDGNLKWDIREQLEDHWSDSLQWAEEDENNTELTVGRFHKLIPPETHEARSIADVLPAACRLLDGIDIQGFENGRAVGMRKRNNSKLTGEQKRMRRYGPVIQKIMDLMNHINHSSRTHEGADHMALIGNGEQMMRRNSRLYLSWDANDEMHRLIDDFEYSSTMNGQCDLVWLHGFQLAHAGAPTREGEVWKHQIAVMRPELSGGFNFAPDGSLASAVASTSRCIRTCVVLDEILQWLRDPEAEAKWRNERAEPEIDRFRLWAGI